MSHQTKTALLDAAETIFSRDGFEGASLREIMRAAEVNPAAIHYHFGGKEGLLTAVLDRAILPINESRRRQLSQLLEEFSPRPIPLRDLISAFLTPDFEAIDRLRSRGPGRTALIAHTYGQPNEFVRSLTERQFGEVSSLYLEQLNRSLPGFPEELVRWRLRWCAVGVIISMFANADLDTGPLADLAAAKERAIDFVTAGMAATQQGDRKSPSS